MASAWRKPLDHWLRKSFDSGVGLTSADLDVLGDCMAAMESVASNLDESTGYFVAHGRLLERLSDAEKDLDRRIAESIEAERRNALSQPIGTAAEVAAGSAAAQDSAAETMVAPTPEHLAAAQDNTFAEHPGTHEATQLVAFEDLALPTGTEGPATDAQVDMEPEEELVADFDPDVASIFTEEATELLEVCESRWRPGAPIPPTPNGRRP